MCVILVFDSRARASGVRGGVPVIVGCEERLGARIVAVKHGIRNFIVGHFVYIRWIGGR